MKKDRITEALSAYIDGEARNAQSIARRVQQDPAYAKRYLELSRLSTQLKRLTPPDVPPAFLTRVMDEVDSAKPVRRTLPAYVLPLAAAAVLLVVIAVGLALWPNVPDLKVARNGETQSAGGMRLSPAEKAAARAELEAQILAGNYEELAAEIEYLDGRDYFDAVDDDLFFALAETEWFDSLVASFEAQEDMDALLETLTVDETSAFEKLLEAQAKEGWTS